VRKSKNLVYNKYHVALKFIGSDLGIVLQSLGVTAKKFFLKIW